MPGLRRQKERKRPYSNCGEKADDVVYILHRQFVLRVDRHFRLHSGGGHRRQQFGDLSGG